MVVVDKTIRTSLEREVGDRFVLRVSQGVRKHVLRQVSELLDRVIVVQVMRPVMLQLLDWTKGTP